MKNIFLAIATIGLSLLAPHVEAGYTSVNANLDEATAGDVLHTIYGGNFQQTGVDLTNGTVTAVRVDDGHDQLWTGDFTAKIVGRFSGYSQSFGTAAGREFQSLMTAQGIGYSTSNYEADLSLHNAPLLRSGDSGTQSSLESGNRDGRDHLITYQVQTGAPKAWLLFWEDLNTGPSITRGRSSADFNDLVVMLRSADDVSAPPPAPIAVPLPPAAYVGLATMGLAVWIVARRRF